MRLKKTMGHARPASQSASAPVVQPTLRFITPPPSPTLNPTEVAEENMSAIAPIVTPIPLEMAIDAGVSNLRPFVALAFNAQIGPVMDGTPNTMNAFLVQIDLNKWGKHFF
jgi:hypothetical protein